MISLRSFLFAVTIGTLFFADAVAAQVASLDSFSGHADRNELRRYVEALTGDIKKIAVIHGEESQALAFAEVLRMIKPKAEVLVPEYQQTLDV